MLFLVKTYPKKANTPRVNRPFEEIEADHKKRRKSSIPIGKGKFRLKGIILYPALVVMVMILMAMASSYQENMALTDVKVNIIADEDNRFLDASDIKQVLTRDGEIRIIGERMNSGALMELEQALIENPSIMEAEVYKNIRGVLNVEVALRKPVARLINNEGNYIYLDKNGKKFPDSDRHSAHVVLVRGDFDEAVADTFECGTIESALPVLNFIHENEFWNAQISEVVIRQNGELTLYPQVGNLYIEFGYPDRIEDKFNNLRDFYRQVIREVGEGQYRYVNLKFRDQVVAKRR